MADDETTNDWLSGLNEQDKLLVEQNGWKSPADVLDNFRALQKFTGVPKDQLLRMPQKPEDWEAFYTQLGRPEKPEAYEYEVPEGGDAELAEWAKQTFHQMGLTQDQAKKFFEAWDGHASALQEQQAGALEDQLAEQQATLKRLWGGAHEQNMGLAKAGARALGLDEKTIDALQKQLGFDGVMVAMEGIGRKVGEAQYHSGETAIDDMNAVLSPDKARARIEQLHGDTEFMEQYLGGNPNAHAKMVALRQMESPETNAG